MLKVVWACERESSVPGTRTRRTKYLRCSTAACGKAGPRSKLRHRSGPTAPAGLYTWACTFLTSRMSDVLRTGSCGQAVARRVLLCPSLPARAGTRWQPHHGTLTGRWQCVPAHPQRPADERRPTGRGWLARVWAWCVQCTWSAPIPGPGIAPCMSRSSLSEHRGAHSRLQAPGHVDSCAVAQTSGHCCEVEDVYKIALLLDSRTCETTKRNLPDCLLRRTHAL